MRILYPLAVFMCSVFVSKAQFREVLITGNPVLHNAYARQQKEDLKVLEQLTGLDFRQLPQRRQGCPMIDPDVTYVISGDSVIIEIDTVGQNGGGGSLAILNDPPLQFGVAVLDGSKVVVKGNAGVDAGRDTLWVEFCDAAGECETRVFPLLIKRAGAVIIQTAPVFPPKGIDTYCIDNVNLPGDLMCNELLDCPDNYGGEGRQLTYFTTYDQPDRCVVYQASRFPGVDTVCVVLCDEYTVCDTFKVLFEIQGDTLSLPFFEDFSYDGPYPSEQYWLENDVFVNSELGDSLRSVGIATFDGLDEGGRPYGGGFGVADYLTSKPINLAGQAPSDNVVFSFYLQPKGRSYQPRTQDKMILEFKNFSGQWVVVDTIDGLGFIAADSIPEFKYHDLAIDDPNYFFKGFQFRFKNMNPREGAYSTWHLDYIRLDEKRAVGSKDINDIAWVEKPSSFLKSYRAMPLNHFRGFEDQEMLETIKGKLFSHYFSIKSIKENRVTFFEKESNIRIPVDSFQVFNVGGLEFQPDQFRETTVNFLSQTNEAGSELIRNEIIDLTKQNPLSSLNKMTLNVRYNLLVDSAETIITNNQVSSCTILDNYFAYDDGTAERALEANGIGTKIAVKFRANVKDTLRAVQFHFPRVNGDVSGQLFTLQVWIGELDSLDNVPDYQLIFKKPIYPSNFTDTLEAFTTYVLTDSMDRGIEIPAGDFYVGWQQESASTSPIPVGLDVNNPNAIENLYFNLGNKWEQFGSGSFFIPGALMIRPVMGSVTPPATSQVDEAGQNANSSLSLKLFPNPAGDVLNMKLSRQQQEDFRFQIFNSTGQIVKSGIFEPQISTAGLAEGMYFVKAFSNKNARMLTERFFIVR